MWLGVVLVAYYARSGMCKVPFDLSARDKVSATQGKESNFYPVFALQYQNRVNQQNITKHEIHGYERAYLCSFCAGSEIQAYLIEASVCQGESWHAMSPQPRWMTSPLALSKSASTLLLKLGAPLLLPLGLKKMFSNT